MAWTRRPVATTVRRPTAADDSTVGSSFVALQHAYSVTCRTSRYVSGPQHNHYRKDPLLNGRFVDAPQASELAVKLRRVASDLRVLAAKADTEKASKALDLAARIEAIVDEIEAEG